MTHCKRTTETLLASGTIRSLKRCHCTISHCVKDFLAPARGATTFRTAPLWLEAKCSGAPCGRQEFGRHDLMSASNGNQVSPVGAGLTRGSGLIAPFSPRHPCQMEMKRRVP